MMYSILHYRCTCNSGEENRKDGGEADGSLGVLAVSAVVRVEILLPQLRDPLPAVPGQAGEGGVHDLGPVGRRVVHRHVVRVQVGRVKKER